MAFDFRGLQGYREGNRLEFKEARVQLPRSFWETYSSFANTEAAPSSELCLTAQKVASTNTGR